MKEALVNALFEKYEFLRPYGTMQDTLMWFGPENKDGWYD